MKVIYTAGHTAHRAAREFNRGELCAPHECPERAHIILDALRAAKRYQILPCQEHSIDRVLGIHSRAYVDFLRSAFGEWVALNRAGDALPMAWPARRLRNDRLPESLDGKLGYYSFDQGTPITSGTWLASVGAVDVALTAAEHLVAGERAAFALCRPPGHHAAHDTYGGYCYLNNTAIATQRLLDSGLRRVAIIDVDYHHGNGTQSIFYERDDVLFASIHGDPATEFPYFLGYEDEQGIGKGYEYNLNRPLPRGTGWIGWKRELSYLCSAIKEFTPDAVVVSLGVDTYKEDPISRFTLDSENFPMIGKRIGSLGYKTLFVMEGGYAINDVGMNVEGVLRGFCHA